MAAHVVNGIVLLAMGALWLASGTQSERRVLSPPAGGATQIEKLEADVAASPGDDAKVRALGQAYLDAKAPGLALALVERSAPDLKTRPKVEHLYARALLDEGRAADALAVEREVLTTCTMADGICDAWLVASARRRADILAELVGLGVEDAEADPEVTTVAYHNATREARLALR